MRVIESILGQLLSIVKDETAPNEVSQLAFQLLYHITKVISQLITQSCNYSSIVTNSEEGSFIHNMLCS